MCIFIYYVIKLQPFIDSLETKEVQKERTSLMLSPCPSCSRRLARNATVCPKCGSPLSDGWAVEAQAKEKKTKKKVALWTVVFMGLFCMPALWEHFTSTPETRRAAMCSNAGRIDAFVKSQRFVKQKLRAPSTANFPLITAEGVVSRWINDCEFDVIAFVDAENGFGAKVRSKYEASLSYAPDADRWLLKQIQIE